MGDKSTTKEARIHSGEKKASSINGVKIVKIGQLRANQTGILYHTMHKNKFKID